MARMACTEPQHLYKGALYLFLLQHFSVTTHPTSGPGSSVDVATDDGMDGPGSNPGRDEIFRPSRPALGPTHPPVKWVPGLSRGQTAAGACRHHGRVELYLYPLSGPQRACNGITLPLPIPLILNTHSSVCHTNHPVALHYQYNDTLVIQQKHVFQSLQIGYMHTFWLMIKPPPGCV